MKKDVIGVGLRVDLETHRKIKYIADYEGRTINGQALYLMKDCIRNFEKQHGPIPEDKTP